MIYRVVNKDSGIIVVFFSSFIDYKFKFATLYFSKNVNPKTVYIFNLKMLEYVIITKDDFYNICINAKFEFFFNFYHCCSFTFIKWKGVEVYGEKQALLFATNLTSICCVHKEKIVKNDSCRRLYIHTNSECCNI